MCGRPKTISYRAATHAFLVKAQAIQQSLQIFRLPIRFGGAMKTRKFLALALMILIPVWTASAQSDRGSITGTVTDPSGAAVSGVKITATNLETGEVRDTVTNDEGIYNLPELKAGPYKLTVEGQGFKNSTFENIQVAVQVTRRADVTLEVGSVTDVVTVTSEAPVIQVENA